MPNLSLLHLFFLMCSWQCAWSSSDLWSRTCPLIPRGGVLTDNYAIRGALNQIVLDVANPIGLPFTTLYRFYTQ